MPYRSDRAPLRQRNTRRRLATVWKAAAGIAAVCLTGVLTACEHVSDERVPNMAVSINLADPGLWNTYGVAGTGHWRYFIKALRQPSGFAYTERSATGFGGVLLIGGMDPFQGVSDVPLAYDLSCPVECSPSVRVAIDPSTLEAVCPDCGSHYDVLMSGGAPVSGPALTGNHKYALRRYTCLPGQLGGYLITN